MEIERTVRSEDVPFTKALWAAVIVQAKMDLDQQIYPRTRSKRVSEIQAAKMDAEAWLNAASEEPFGFGWACSHLGIDPDRTKRHIYGRG